MSEILSEPRIIKPEEVEKQIIEAEALMSQFSARTLGEVITVAMGRYGSDVERVAQSLVDLKVFEKTHDCPDPLSIAKATMERYKEFGEGLRPEEKPL